jgi:hypothetical protein
VRVARSYVRAINIVRDWISVAAGCELRSRVTRSESQAITYPGVFKLVISGGRDECL